MITKHIASVEHALGTVWPEYRSEWELFDDDPRTAYADVDLADGASRLDVTLTYDRFFDFQLQGLLSTGAVTVPTPAMPVDNEWVLAEQLRRAHKTAEQLRADVYEPLAADPALLDLVPEPRKLAVSASITSITGGHALLTTDDGTDLLMDVIKGRGDHWYITSVEPGSDATSQHLVEQVAEAICALPAGKYLPVNTTAGRLAAALDDDSATAHLSQMTPLGGRAIIDLAGSDAIISVRSPLGADPAHLEVSFTSDDDSDDVLLYRSDDLSLPSAQVMNALVPAIEQALDFQPLHITSVRSVPQQLVFPEDEDAEIPIGVITLDDGTEIDVKLEDDNEVWLYNDDLIVDSLFVGDIINSEAASDMSNQNAALAAAFGVLVRRLERRGRIS